MRIVALIFSALLLTSCGSSTMTVKGNLTIADPSGITTAEDLGSCQGSGGYDDLASGANVVIQDATGKKVAIGSLGPGDYSADHQSCIFRFDVTDVPDDQKFYSIAIGHRDPFDFKKADADWLILTIGD